MVVPENATRHGTASSQDAVARGREVIRTEAEGLAALASSLDGSFEAAVRLCVALRGRVIATGIGKSGYVARKVAATLASTGSPAVFVHPAEAAHGDLGVLMPGDAVLVFSNSGETVELLPILMHAAKLGLPVIGITGGQNSRLMRQAEVKLLLPPMEEACSDNLAPTTSTAMMMALGDALALALMEARGSQQHSFEELHPGGAIGKRLMRIAAVMHQGDSMPLVALDTPLRDVIMTITSGSFGIAGVVDGGGRLVGAITDGDLRRHIDSSLESPAREVMTRDPVCVSPTCLVEDALAQLNRHKITAMFAVEDDSEGEPVGIVHVHDFLRLGLA